MTCPMMRGESGSALLILLCVSDVNDDGGKMTVAVMILKR
jgi:hypothetical protein